MLHRMTVEEVARILGTDRRRSKRPAWEVVPERQGRVSGGVLHQRMTVVGSVVMQSMTRIIG
jgi:hypothetical protein